MRKTWVVAGLLLVVAGTIGVIGRSPFDPSPPPDEVPRRVAKDRPEKSAAAGSPSPDPSQAAPGGPLQVQRLVRRRAFDQVTRVLEEKQARLEADVRREDELGRALAAFATADPALTALLDEWILADERGWAPRLARAKHRVALAWEKRGTKRASDTSEEQLAGMRAALAGVIEDAREALHRHPKLTEAYATLLAAARGYGDQTACLRFAHLALSIEPASFRVREALIACMLPRWGGSYEVVAGLAREAQAHVARNPKLAALLGSVDWDRGRVAVSDRRYDEGVDLFTRALAAGECDFFYHARADAYQRQKRHTDALADVARALALAPHATATVLLRAKVLVALGRRAEALADIQLVSELDPTDDALARFRTNQTEDAVKQGYQLMEMTKDLSGAVDRYTWALQLDPDNAEALYWRGRVYLRMDDRTRALADFEAAVRVDPRHFEAYRNIDWILAQRGEWDAIIGHWTRYIELEPLNGQAYLERGGAYNRKGDRPTALADARKACDLGTPKACEIHGLNRPQTASPRDGVAGEPGARP
jgi:tetratricopeptide (TPR) repeat protein